MKSAIAGPMLGMLAAGAVLLAPAAGAATPEEAARAKACGVPASAIERSVKLEPELKRFDAEVAHVTRGAGETRLIVFSDYSCGACKALNPTFAKLATDPDVRVELAEYPIYGRTFVSSVTGNKTLNATRIGLAVAEQSSAAYIAYHDSLMAARGGVSNKQIDRALEASGADAAKAKSRAEDKDIKAEAEANMAFAKAIGINGTPGLVAGGVVVSASAWSPALMQCLAGKTAG
ncbi:MAG: DsbA family protein [Hyphomonadaceae bacterium]